MLETIFPVFRKATLVVRVCRPVNVRIDISEPIFWDRCRISHGKGLDYGKFDFSGSSETKVFVTLNPLKRFANVSTSGLDGAVGKRQANKSVELHSDEFRPVESHAVEPCTIHFEIPGDMNVHASVDQGELVIHGKYEAEDLSINVLHGSVKLDRIKSHELSIKVGDGLGLRAAMIQGKAFVECGGDAAINIVRLTGPENMISSAKGPISVDALYGGHSKIVSSSGAVAIGSTHGRTEIRALAGRGTVDVRAVDGDIAVTSVGESISMNLVSAGKVSASSSSGDIKVLFPHNYNGKLTCRSEPKRIAIDPSVRATETGSLDSTHNGTEKQFIISTSADGSKKIGHPKNISRSQRVEAIESSVQGEPSVRLVSRQGRITLGMQDWLSSVVPRVSE